MHIHFIQQVQKVTPGAYLLHLFLDAFSASRFEHTNRPGFWFGLIDFCTAGIFFLFYMPLSDLQDEIDAIIGRRTQTA